MVCIFCDKKTIVKNSRYSKRSSTVWRRRSCTSCQALFSTTETVEWSTAIKVQTSTDLLVDFKRAQLFASVYEALKYTKNSDENADEITSTVINKMLKKHSPIWQTLEIRQTCIESLEAFDETSASVYKALYR